MSRGHLTVSCVVLLLVVSWRSSVCARPAEPGALDGAQPATSAGGTPSAETLLLRAVAHYQRSEFDEARRLLLQILRSVGGERIRTVQEAYTYLAFVHVAFEETEAAVQAFERALAIQPDLTLSSPAPRIVAALDQARQRYRARVRALDHDPPQQSHAPVARAAYARAITVEDQVSDLSGVRRVVLNYRVAGHRGFSSVTMERGRAGHYVGTIPASSVVRPGVEYFLEAWDALGNGPGLKGSPGAPILVQVEGGPVARLGPTRRSRWYERWWVWATAAGVLAAGATAVAVVYVSRSETAQLDFRMAGGTNP